MSWIVGIVSPPACPPSVETTTFAPTTLNFDILDYFFTKDERTVKSNNIKYIADMRLESSELYHP